jgi:hypothetical protein
VSATPERAISVTHAGSRHVLGYDATSYQLWQLSRLRHRKIAKFPLTAEGSAAGMAAFASREPTAGYVVDPPRPFRPRRLTTAGMWTVALAAVVVLGGAALTGFAVTASIAPRRSLLDQSVNGSSVVSNGQPAGCTRAQPSRCFCSGPVPVTP